MRLAAPASARVIQYRSDSGADWTGFAECPVVRGWPRSATPACPGSPPACGSLMSPLRTPLARAAGLMAHRLRCRVVDALSAEQQPSIALLYPSTPVKARWRAANTVMSTHRLNGVQPADEAIWESAADECSAIYARLLASTRVAILANSLLGCRLCVFRAMNCRLVGVGRVHAWMAID